MFGASVGVGLAAVDAHGGATGSASQPTLTLTPTAAGEAAVFLAQSNSATITAPVGNTFSFYIPTGSINNVAEWLDPASGTPIVATYGGTSAVWTIAGAIIKSAGGAPATMNITNPGTVRAEKITLDILGPAINPTIVNTTNGLSLTVNTTVAGGQHLIIDTGVYTALNNGVSVIGGVRHSPALRFFTLEVGVNALTATASGATGATTLTVSFAPPWM